VSLGNPSVFSFFLYFTISHHVFPPCPFVKHTTPPHTHTHTLTFTSSCCLRPTPIVSSYIDSFEVYFCPSFVRSLSRDLPLSPLCVPHSHWPAILLSTTVSMALTKYCTPPFNRAKERLLKRGVQYFVNAIETVVERRMAGQ